MNYLGVDLAWGERGSTGVAVLDSNGGLVHLSRAGDDDSIVAALGDHARGHCVVGIDAPLVVVNPSGSRPCETALNRDFARFDAGAHPSNTAKPEFSGPPRGARLAARLGLDIDPASLAPRRAIEVYPHPALVVLFGLGRALKYKQRSNRSFASLRAEMLRLTSLLEGLASFPIPARLAGNPDWDALVAAIGAAGRKSELRRAEDQLDAVVCAYVAMLAAKNPGSTTVYGDLETGYILTPTLPADLRPSPRERTSTDPGGEAVRTYARLQPQIEESARRLAVWLTVALDDAGIDYLSVAWRGKSITSFAAKTNRSVAGTLTYPDPLQGITDQIGARVITYVTGDVAAVADLIADQLRVVEDKDLGRETASEGRFGYVSRHLQVALDPAWLGDLPVDGVRVPSAQIQIRTVLQHAWAQFEHDIRYKGTVPESLAPDLDRRFTLAAGLLELADREFEIIRDRLREEMADGAPEPDAYDPRIANQELAAFLAGHYPEAGWSRTDHYSWMSGLLLELGITSLRELADLLPAVDSVPQRMGYRYPPGAVRRLDDTLLALFGERYLGLHGNAHRIDLLRARLAKLAAADAITEG